MSKKKGSIVWSMLCINVFVGLLSILIINLTTIFQTVIIAQQKELEDRYKLHLLIYIGKQYIKIKRDTVHKGIIFDGTIPIGTIDTIHAKIAVYQKGDEYKIEGTLFCSGGTKKIMQKIVKKV